MLLTSMSRTNIFHRAIFLIVPILCILHSTPVCSQEDPPVPPSTDDALEEELKYLKAETYVITASGILEDIKKTAASITVVTDKEIYQMGARDLSDVLQTVPGTKTTAASMGSRNYHIRGPTEASEKILLMINGHILNENFTGGAIIAHDKLILDNAKRIEIIRGPASALYGANALMGVINVITKDAEDIDGWEVTARGGSFDTQYYNLLYGKTFNNLDVVFNYNYFNTHGFNKHVDEDMQTSLDRIFLTNASLAPGRVKGDDEKYDAFLSLKYKGLTLEGKYVERKRDLPVGRNPVLNQKSIWNPKDSYLTLSYERTLWEGIDFSGKVYRNHYTYRNDYQLSPPWLSPAYPMVVAGNYA